MDLELASRLTGRKREAWIGFLAQAGLEADENVQTTALVWEDGRLVAAGSRQDNVLKCIAVDPAHQGEGLTATLLTALRQDATAKGYRHLFLYTKPRNKTMFSSLFFYPVTQTDQVLLMESRKSGVQEFVDSLDAPGKGVVGAAVMNCNPFTRGHRYLIETAARACDWLYVFVLSEEKSLFPAADRLTLVRAGTADIPNVTVHPTGPYLISSATFPTYFLKEKDQFARIHCQLDIEVFVRYFVPRFGISRRYVGTEPLSPVTAQYNEALRRFLPPRGVELVEIPRIESGELPISASAVRGLLGKRQPELLRKLVPESTFAYLKEKDMI